MKTLKYDNIERLFAIGDIHGDFDAVEEFVRESGIKNSMIIICGDCGLGFNPISNKANDRKTLSALSREFSKNGNILILLRGNHDNPAWFNGHDSFCGKGARTVPDYTIIKIPSHTLLLIGGAISIDRVERTEGHSYWRDEDIVYNESEFAKLSRLSDKPDILLSHTAPRIATEIYTAPKYWVRFDEELSQDLEKSWEKEDKIFLAIKSNNIPIKKWYYGHFHKSKTTIADEIIFKMLNIKEIIEI